MPTALVTHLLQPDPSGVADLLADDVRFSSPFADYAGRDRISGLFAVIPEVFDELEPRRELTGADPSEVATVLHGRVGEHALDAVIDERYAADGRVAEVMVLLRPLPAVEEAIRRMGRLLAG